MVKSTWKKKWWGVCVHTHMYTICIISLFLQEESVRSSPSDMHLPSPGRSVSKPKSPLNGKSILTRSISDANVKKSSFRRSISRSILGSSVVTRNGHGDNLHKTVSWVMKTNVWVPLGNPFYSLSNEKIRIFPKFNFGIKIKWLFCYNFILFYEQLYIKCSDVVLKK